MRIEAEARLKQVPEDLSELTPQQIRSMFQELRVHQIELEMQNEELREMQAQLAAARARYFDLYDLAPVGYVTINELGLLLEVNLTASTLLGVMRGSLDGYMFSGSVFKEDQSTYYYFHKHLFESGATQACELRMVKKDGSTVWVHLDGTSGTTPDGHHVGRIVINNISARKLAEARTVRVSMLYASLSGCGHAIVHSTSAAGMLSEICRIVVERGGLKMAWIGTPDPQSGRILPSASYGKGLDYLSQIEFSINSDEPGGCGVAGTAFREGIAVWCHDYQNDPSQEPWSGAERRYGWGSAAAIPLLLRGKAVAVLVIYSDMAWAFDQEIRELLVEMADNVGLALEHFAGEDERKQTLEELQVLRTAVEQAADGFIITDPAGTIEYVNPAFEKSTGFTSAELLGQNPRILNSGEQGHLFYRQLWSTITSGTVWRGEFHNRRKDGSLFWEWATISPVLNESRQIVHFVAIKEDITKRKAIEASLATALLRAEAANRAKSEFLGVMSHELRTPLNGVLGFAAILADTPLDSEQKDYVNTISLSGEHLLAIVSDILNFASIEAGTLAIHVAPLAVADLLKTAENIVRKTADEKGVELRCELAAGTPEQITGDEVRMRQILINLLGNAVKFTASGSVVLRVATGSDGGGYLDFSVEDTGIGISSDDLSRLFQPFVQADSKRNRRFGGTGLGLAISRRIAEAMGGTITAASTPGKGSLFTFRFPLETASVRARENAPVLTHISDGERNSLELIEQSPAIQTDSSPTPTGGGLVLVVDDNRTSSMIAGKMLERLGYRVEFAASGDKAVEAFVPGKFSAILMDMAMPLMDGLEATGKIREVEAAAYGHVSIFAFTANVLPGERERCLAAGMDDFLSKPLRSDDLAAKLANRHGER